MKYLGVCYLQMMFLSMRLVDEAGEGLGMKLDNWKEALESKDLKICRMKIE